LLKREAHDVKSEMVIPIDEDLGQNAFPQRREREGEQFSEWLSANQLRPKIKGCVGIREVKGTLGGEPLGTNPSRGGCRAHNNAHSEVPRKKCKKKEKFGEGG